MTVGVCYITAEPGKDVDALVVRMVMTRDTASAESTTRRATGPDNACRVLRDWMVAMCDAPAGGREGS